MYICMYIERGDNMELIDLLVDEDKKNYKCYRELKRLLNENETFKQTVASGISEGKIRGFDDDLWKKIHSQNIRNIDNFESVFRDGANIGYCTPASKQLSFSFNKCYICGGVLPILKGTTNCEDGSHTWIAYNNEIIDTTLMLIIDNKYAKEIGYQEENRYDPNLDKFYSAAKKWTIDPKIRGASKK